MKLDPATIDSSLRAAGALLALVGVVVAGRALFRDRSRGRRRCPRCWYDMAGVPGLMCPECGRGVRRERVLRRTRRHWRRATVGVALLLVAGAIALVPRARRDGVLAVVPLRLLVYFAPTQEEEQAYISRIGMPGVLPPVAAELQRRLDTGGFSAREWALILEHSRVLRTRGRWPVTNRLAVEVRPPEWLAQKQGLSVRPRLREARPITTAMCRSITFGGPRIFEVGWLERGTRRVEFEVTLGEPIPVSLGAPAGTSAAERETLVRLSVRAVETPQEVLTALDTPELRAQVLGALTLALVVKGPREDPSYSISVQLDPTRIPEPPGFGMGLEIEVECRRGGVAETQQLDVLGLRKGTTYNCFFSSLTPAQVRDPVLRELWVVRVRGSPGPALADETKTSYWSGELAFRLGQLPIEDVARPPHER